MNTLVIKILFLSTRYKNHLKRDAFDGSVVNVSIQTLMFCFVLDKPPRYRVFCVPEAKHYIKQTNLF